MKKLVFILAVAAFTACNSGTSTDSKIDSSVDAKKDMIDSSTSAKKDMMDSSADAKKSMLDSSAKMMKDTAKGKM